MKNLAFFMSLLIAFNLSGCGFQLRGPNNFTPELRSLYLESNDPRNSLTPQLTAYLQELGVHFTATARQAPVTLVLISDNFNQTGTTLGTAEQLNTITLTYTVVFALRNSHQQNIAGPFTVSSSNSYLQAANQILGDTTAVPAIKQGLVRDVIQQITAHLNATNVRKDLLKQL